jgi:hypothetical protein
MLYANFLAKNLPLNNNFSVQQAFVKQLIIYISVLSNAMFVF